KAKQWIPIAADADLGNAARVLIDVRTGNTHVGAGREPIPRGGGDVVVVGQPAAHVQDRLRAEHSRPGHAGAAARVGAGAGEAAIGWTAVLTEQARIEDHRPHEADAVGHLILRAYG